MPVLKTCSKCKKDLPIKRFAKSPNYMSGRISHCCYCRKETKTLYLASFTLCIRCKSAPHRPSNPYCFDCLRTMDRRNKGERKRTMDRSNKTLCCKCKSAPRCKHHNYCQSCKNAYTNEWLKRKGGSWAWRISDPVRRVKVRARAILNTAVVRGKIKRMPCEVCGNPETEAHHYLGYAKENALKVRWLCKRHHAEAERIEKSHLTEQPLLL